MKTTVEKIKDHFKKKSKLALVGDIIFYTLLLLIILPATRMQILPHLQRLVMFAPSTSKRHMESLKPEAYTYSFRGYDQEIQTLEQYRGEVLFINFWATWCPPCVAEMPSIQKLYDDYKGKVTFVLLSADSKEEVEQFVEKHGFDLPLYQQIASPPEQLYSQSIPATYVISRTGEIVISKSGIAKWNSPSVYKTLDSLLAEPVK